MRAFGIRTLRVTLGAQFDFGCAIRVLSDLRRRPEKFGSRRCSAQAQNRGGRWGMGCDDYGKPGTLAKCSAALSKKCARNPRLAAPSLGLGVQRPLLSFEYQYADKFSANMSFVYKADLAGNCRVAAGLDPRSRWCRSSALDEWRSPAARCAVQRISESGRSFSDQSKSDNVSEHRSCCHLSPQRDIEPNCANRLMVRSSFLIPFFHT